MASAKLTRSLAASGAFGLVCKAARDAAVARLVFEALVRLWRGLQSKGERSMPGPVVDSAEARAVADGIVAKLIGGDAHAVVVHSRVNRGPAKSAAFVPSPKLARQVKAAAKALGLAKAAPIVERQAKRGQLSAAGRAAIVKAQRERWARLKAEQAARSKGQRRRWAKFYAAQDARTKRHNVHAAIEGKPLVPLHGAKRSKGGAA